MIIIGELINATRKSVNEIMVKRDTAGLLELARRQAAAGADYLDVNAATGALGDSEPAAMEWAVTTILKEMDVALSIDSASPEVMQAALKAGMKKVPILNSVNAEPERLEAILPLAKSSGASMICLAMGKGGISEKASERLAMCRAIYDRAVALGITPDRLFFDPLIMTVATSPEQGRVTIETLRRIKAELPGAKTTAGLSNVSFGLPNRAVLNRTFLVMLMEAGLDSAIMNPCDKDAVDAMRAADVILGTDTYCKKYLKACREAAKNKPAEKK